MRYRNVTKARFLERPNRFIALVEREEEISGREHPAGDAAEQSGRRIVERVHVKNTGRCRELLVPGAVVYLERGRTPGRKTAFDLIAVEKETARGPLLINMDAQAPNAVFAEFAAAGRFQAAGQSGPMGQSAVERNAPDLRSEGRAERNAPELCSAEQAERIAPERGPLSDVRSIRREAAWGASRLDFLLDTGHGPHLVEVKGVTLEEDGAARFPDAPTERGVKHLRELTAAVGQGIAATAFFVIQMEGMKAFSPNDATHPAFGAALREAAAAGVDVQAWECAVTPASLDIVRPVPVLL